MTAAIKARILRRPAKRRGYILIVVLGLTAVVASLGWAFLDAHGTVMPEAVNRLGAERARYLAESGIDIGTHFLMYPPTTVSPEDYWRGVSGIAIDGTADYTDVSITQDDTDPHLFAITAVGVAHDPDGAIRGKQSITSSVIRPPDGKWHIPHAILGTSDLDIPSIVEVYGDVHTNGDLNSDAWSQGNVSATDRIWWFGGGPPASITENADPFTSPPADTSLYENYNIRGNAYTAHTTWPWPDIYGWEASNLNAQDWSATNPGRIIVIDGNFRLYDNVRLNGALVVDGDLWIDGDDIELTAVENYPALVVSGEIHFENSGDDITIVGSVVCGDRINAHHKWWVRWDVTGSCIFRNELRSFENAGSVVFRWDPARSVFWDFDVSAEQQPITLLDWKAN